MEILERSFVEQLKKYCREKGCKEGGAHTPTQRARRIDSYRLATGEALLVTTRWSTFEASASFTREMFAGGSGGGCRSSSKKNPGKSYSTSTPFYQSDESTPCGGGVSSPAGSAGSWEDLAVTEDEVNSFASAREGTESLSARTRPKKLHQKVKKTSQKVSDECDGSESEAWDVVSISSAFSSRSSSPGVELSALDDNTPAVDPVEATTVVRLGPRGF